MCLNTHHTWPVMVEAVVAPKCWMGAEFCQPDDVPTVSKLKGRYWNFGSAFLFSKGFKMQKKILVVATGGTIGSTTKSGVTNVNAPAIHHLLDAYYMYAGFKGDLFDVCQPLNILSENICQTDWMLLVAAIKAQKLDRYTGIIVTHGTDTLPYTAAALSYAFSDLEIPVVLVSSNTPLNNFEANGLDNFKSAVNFILDTKFHGVFIIFQNSNRESVVHLGTRLTEATPFTHQFESQKNAYFGTMINNHFVHNSASVYNPTMSSLLSHVGVKMDSLAFSDRIVSIQPYPNLNYNLFNFSVTRPDAVLHKLYHSGTACTDSHDYDKTRYSVLNFAKRCHAENITFYIVGLTIAQEAVYSTTKELLDLGIIPLYDITMEAAVVKLSMAYGLFKYKKSITDFINTNMFFEFSQRI